MKRHGNKLSKIKWIGENFSAIFVSIYILLILAIVLIFQDNIYIPIHDVLDSFIGQYKVLHDSHQFFASSDAIVQYLGGIDRDFMPSELKVYSWPFIIFEPFLAMIVLHILRILISVFGSLYLINSVLGQEGREYRNIIILCGFIYGILPSSPMWDTCFAIYPFLVAQIYKVYKDARLRDAFILFIVPFFSELAHFGIFICGYLLLFIIADWFIKKKPNLKLIIALLLISFGYVLSEYRMFRVVLLKGTITLRESGEYVQGHYSIFQVIKDVIDVFLNGQYHGGTFHKYLILPLCFIYIMGLLERRLKEHNLKKVLSDPVIVGMLFAIVNSFIYGLEAYRPFKDMFIAVFPFMEGIGIERIIRINSFVWYLILGILMCKLQKIGFKLLPIAICVGMIFITIITPGVYNSIYYNLHSALYKVMGRYEETPLTFREFYSEDLFRKIKDDIVYNGEWSVAFGMHPAILSYNEINTLDGYHSWYSLDYKYKFRKLIEPELQVDEVYRNYFDNWGGRAYLYSREATFEPVRDMGVESVPLRINSSVFDEMGGKYIFSRVEISNSRELGIALQGIYTDENSPYSIHVYKIN